MQALPLLVASAVALVIAPPALRTLADGPLARANFRDRRLPCPLGLVVVAAAVVALLPLAVVAQISGDEVLRPELAWVAIYVLGVSALGLADDALGSGGRGWRGHANDLRAGGFSTGALKAVGAAGLAAYVTAGRGLDDGQFVVAVGVLVLATNTFNLLDLRPGRSLKVFVVLALALTAAAADLHPLWALGLFAGPVVVLGLYDLREQALMGDTGSNLVGALAGAWVVLSLSSTGQLVALVLLAAINVYGEFRSITDLVDRSPLLRRLDSLGRPQDAANG